jgi:hypothetical protein
MPTARGAVAMTMRGNVRADDNRSAQLWR